MKKRVLVLLMSALFLAPTLLSAQTEITENTFTTLRLTTRVQAPVLESVTVNGLGFTTVSVEGFGLTAAKGLPALPFRTEMIEVPQGARPELVIDHVESYTLDLAAAGFPDFIFPAQGPRSKTSARHINKFFFDTATYASYRAPSSPVALGGEATLHGLRLLHLNITPVAYDPASRTLTVYTRINFHIDFKGADMAATQEFKRKYASVAYQGIESGLLCSLRGKMPEAKAAAYTHSPVYVIVSDPMFRDSLQKFVAWKTLLGFRVLEAYTDQTEVGKTKESIRAYLKKLYDEATPENPAPTYVLFVGDVAQIPNETYEDPYPYGDKHVSDLYLCEYTGDRMPDVLYGRMSATKVSELMPQIDKLMYMENIPYEKTDFLDNSFLIAGVDDDYAQSHLNPTINYLHSLYFKDSASRHCSVYLYPESGSATNNIIQNINDGVSVGIYTAHGEWNRWESPVVNNTDIESRFENKDRYPFLVGNCCLTGKMNKPSCFGETLLRKEDAGAVAYIGASNSSYFDEDVYWAVGYTKNISASTVHTYANTGLGANDAFFHTHGEPYAKWALSAAEIMQTGNMAVEGSSTEDKMKTYYWQIYHVFGDPSYMPYNHRPEPITAVYPSVVVLSQPFFEVLSWPYARVALSFEGKNVAFALADGEGMAKLDLSGLSDVGDLSLCISAQNGLPLLDKVKVVLPGNKMVVVRSEEMRPASGGEQVAVWTYGQNYRASYTIRNVGREAVRGFKMRLLSEDTCVKFESEPFVYEGELAVDEEVAVSHEFAVSVSPSVVDQSRISYRMHIEFGHSDSVSESPLLRMVNAPSWEVVFFAVTDSTLVNGVLDAGEKVTGVITVKNAGLAVARNLSASFSCAQDYVRVNSAVQELGDVAPGESVTLYVDMEGAEGDYVQRPYELAVHLRTDGRTDIVEAASFMGVAMETFERGDFSYAAWQNDERNAWEIDDSRAHEGRYSAASKKDLADNAASSLRLEVEMPFDDEISFYYFTSTELQGQSMGDLLNFYIDGTRMGRFGGESEQWGFARYEVEAGLHTFEWRYKKDVSDSEGEDRVWIDDVRLPYKTILNGDVFNEEGGASPQLSSLRLSVVRAHAGRLQVAVRSPRGEVEGVLRVVNVLGATVAVLDPALRAGVETEEHTYEVGDLPSGLYLCTFTTPDGRPTACKFVMR